MHIDERFIKNIGPVTKKQQEILKNSRIFVAGCGGIGGFTIEYLTRCGIGSIVCADDDQFEESNLNRQILAVTNTLGEKKAECACNRARLISPKIEAVCVTDRLNENNLPDLIAGCDLVIDALDNASGRFVLQKACAKKNIPIVHGAVSEWCAQAAIIMPGANLYNMMYNDKTTSTAGTLAFVAATAAAMQSSLAVRYLCGCNNVDGLCIFDLKSMTFEQLGY